MKMSSIKDFYRDQEVFITGASGFIGKALVEKVLRTCSGVKTVYLLMRPKKGQTPEDRIKALTDNVYFSKLKAEQPDAIKKLQAIAGDSKELRLGMSDSDYEKIKSCSMIFHLAASVRFDDHLKDAILLNTRGAREVCELATKMPNLKVLVHVSTAYVQPLKLKVVEELIDVHCDWRDYIKITENLPVEVLDTLTLKLTKHAPNTYTFTKLLAEHICNDYRQKHDLPIVIYRPAIVSWSDHEVLAGWSESLNGMNGICASSMYGLKRVHVGNVVFKVVPVDLCVKGMIIASEKHKKGSGWSDAIPVYNAASVYKFSIKEMDSMMEHLTDPYFEHAIGIPHVVIVRSKLMGAILRFLYQLVPALLIDSVLLMMRRKPMVMKYQRILNYAENAVEAFISQDFQFETKKYKDLGRDLHKDDKEDFYLQPRNEVFQYINNSHIVSKEIVLNETPEKAARAKKKVPYWRSLWWIIKIVFMFIVYKLLFIFYGILRNSFL